MGPVIPKEMKYNLHYGKVRGDVVLDIFVTSNPKTNLRSLSAHGSLYSVGIHTQE